MRDLHQDNGSKIVMVVADGLGGLPLEVGGKTELEAANTPNLDALVREGACGLLTPIAPGITPSCVAGHLALFGYDPLEHTADENLSTKLPSMQDIYGVSSVCIASSPVARSLASAVGMTVLDFVGEWAEQIDALKSAWNNYDFFFLHYESTNMAGLAGNFGAKVQKIERLDMELPRIRALNPDVLIVTGDHSTPSKLKSHSWHAVPLAFHTKTVRPDGVTEFGESACLHGGLGQFESKYLMSLAMAHAGRIGPGPKKKP